VLTRELDLTAFQIETHLQDSMQFHVVPTYERLEKDFTIAPGVTLPAGQDYRFTRYQVLGSTTSRRPLAISPRAEWGRFYSGDLVRLNLTANLRAAPGQIFTFTQEWSRVSLAEGQFDTRLYRVIAETQFNPRVALVNNLQYDSQSAVIGWQSRFRWILDPGNDLYLVYVHNWLDGSRGSATAGDRGSRGSARPPTPSSRSPAGAPGRWRSRPSRRSAPRGRNASSTGGSRRAR
jgi:hypothetical protein